MRMLMTAAIGLALATGAAAAPLEALRWQKRIVLVFPQGDANRLDIQRKALADTKGVAERDLLVIEVPKNGSVKIADVGAADAEGLRRAYSVADDAAFTVLLIGKDGGVKRRSAEPMSARDLFATIDAMPMRANEMRGG